MAEDRESRTRVRLDVTHSLRHRYNIIGGERGCVLDPNYFLPRRVS